VEECDDGNDLNGDGCLNDCRRAMCGDGYLHRGYEECDEGAENSDIADAACRTDCEFPECTLEDVKDSCDDENDCTDEVCSGGECAHEFNDRVCDDGIPCTASDVCAGGACVGQDNCPSGQFCNFTIGECQHEAGADSGLWIPAAMYPAVEFAGSLKTSEELTRGDDADPASDSLSSLLVYGETAAGEPGDAAVYYVDLPATGQWFLWGRFYYSGAAGSNASNSFVAAVDDQRPVRFGSRRQGFERWHWDGDGAHDFGPPAPLALGNLAAGPHRLRIAKPNALVDSPRLDMILLIDDRHAVPNDHAAELALEACPFGGCDDSVCGDATANRVISIADAWMILNAAVGSGDYCRLSACDVNGDGAVQAWDAIAVLHSMVGADVAPQLDCRPSVAFGINDAVGAERVSFVVDYSNAGVGFTNKFGSVRCRSAEALRATTFETSDDPVKEMLTVQLEFSEPLTGSMGIAECFARAPEGGALPGPGAYGVVVTQLDGADAGDIPATVSVLPGG
jgi:hypothetical protein